MTEPVAATPTVEGASQGPQFAVDRVYIKDLSLESPGAPQSFQIAEAPQVEIGLRSRAEKIGEDAFECVLTLTVTATVAGKTLFLVEVAQAGIFGIRGVPLDQMQQVLAVHCPNVLFPYAREAIADSTMRAGFPPVHLAPFNFEAFYAQQLEQQAAAAPAVTN